MSHPLPPDAGLREISARMFPGPPADQAGPPGGGGVELDIFARLAVSLDGLATQLRNWRRAQIPWEFCHRVPLNPIVVGTSAASDERWEPRADFAWHITRVSAQSAASGGATSVIAAQDSTVAGAWNLQSFPPPGVTGVAGAFLGCWEPKGTFLLPGNRMVFLATGGTASINGEAIEIALDWLPTYLM